MRSTQLSPPAQSALLPQPWQTPLMQCDSPTAFWQSVQPRPASGRQTSAVQGTRHSRVSRQTNSGDAGGHWGAVAHTMVGTARQMPASPQPPTWQPASEGTQASDPPVEPPELDEPEVLQATAVAHSAQAAIARWRRNLNMERTLTYSQMNSPSVPGQSLGVLQAIR